MHYCPDCDNACYCQGDEEDELCPVPEEGCAHRCESAELDLEGEEEDLEIWCFECDRPLGKGDCDSCYSERTGESEEDEEDEDEG